MSGVIFYGSTPEHVGETAAAWSEAKNVEDKIRKNKKLVFIKFYAKLQTKEVLFLCSKLIQIYKYFILFTNISNFFRIIIDNSISHNYTYINIFSLLTKYRYGGLIVMHKRIGEKVKQLRISRNMTLKDLSERADLSVSHLSQFERGISSLSLYSLERVAAALETPLNDFMPSTIRHENRSYIIRAYERNPVNVSFTGRYYNSLNNNMPESTLEPMLIIMLPQEQRKDFYIKPHQGEEFVYVVEGVLTVLIDNKKYTLYPGDSMHYLASSPHEWLNLTSHDVRLISVNTPRVLSAPALSESDESQN